LVTTTSLDSDLMAEALTRVQRLTGEGLIGMSAAAKVYGEARTGKAPHASTPTRHALNGHRLRNGRVLKLEAIRIAGRLMTTRQAVLRFFAAQNLEDDTIPTPDPLSAAKRNRQHAVASAELDAVLGTGR
jgi:hypothetical protein